jgi:hypothetical protein
VMQLQAAAATRVRGLAAGVARLGTKLEASLEVGRLLNVVVMCALHTSAGRGWWLLHESCTWD